METLAAIPGRVRGSRLQAPDQSCRPHGPARRGTARPAVGGRLLGALAAAGEARPQRVCGFRLCRAEDGRRPQGRSRSLSGRRRYFANIAPPRARGASRSGRPGRTRTSCFPARTGGRTASSASPCGGANSAAAAGVSGLRFHDLRHTSATIALASGVHPKVVQGAPGALDHQRHAGHVLPRPPVHAGRCGATGSRRQCPSSTAGIAFERIDDNCSSGQRRGTIAGVSARHEIVLVGATPRPIGGFGLVWLWRVRCDPGFSACLRGRSVPDCHADIPEVTEAVSSVAALLHAPARLGTPPTPAAAGTKTTCAAPSRHSRTRRHTVPRWRSNAASAAAARPCPARHRPLGQAASCGHQPCAGRDRRPVLRGAVRETARHLIDRARAAGATFEPGSGGFSIRGTCEPLASARHRGLALPLRDRLGAHGSLLVRCGHPRRLRSAGAGGAERPAPSLRWSIGGRSVCARRVEHGRRCLVCRPDDAAKDIGVLAERVERVLADLKALKPQSGAGNPVGHDA